jgi:hypothetical protein
MPAKKDLKERKTTKKDKYAGLMYHLTTWLKLDRDSDKRKDQEKLWSQITRNYKGNLPPKNFPWKGAANVNTLVTLYMVDGIALRLKNFLMGKEFKADLKTSDIDAYEQVETVEDFINPVMNVVVEIGNKINELTHRAAKIACITRLDWVVEHLKKDRYVEKIEQVPFSEFSPEEQAPFRALASMSGGELPETVPVPKKELEEYEERQESAKLTFVPLFDFLVPDDATNLENASRTTQRMWLTLDYMKDKEFDNIDKVETWLTEKKMSDALNEDERNLIKNGDISFGEEKVEIWETTTVYTIDGKKDKYVLYFHEETMSLLKKIEFRKIWGDSKSQFQRFVIKEDGTFSGMGIGEVCLASHAIINDTINSLLNMTSLKILGIIFIGENAFEYDEKMPINLKLKPGAVNPVKDVKEIVFRDFPGDLGIGLEAIDQLITMLERAIGLSAPMLSQPTEEKKTLGEVNLIKAEGDLRHMTFFQSPGEAFKDLIKTVLSLYQKNMPPGMFDKLVNEKGDLVFDDAITRESIQGNFTPTIKGAVGLQLQAEKQALALGLIKLLTDPEEIKRLGNPRELVEDALDVVDIDPEKKLRSEQEILEEKIEVQKLAIVELAAKAKVEGAAASPGPQPSPEIANIIGGRR